MRKITRKKGNALERWEIALIKAMLGEDKYNDQDILAHFTRPTRSVNARVIGEIRKGDKHKPVRPASSDDLASFLATWPDVDNETGLSLRGDELLIKAREAMIAAVHTFNGAGLTFRAELFIVSAIIAWTYLMHAWFKREGIDYRYPEKTKQGADKFWELGKCVRNARCPLSTGTVKNLEFLLELRHEIEHQSTNRIDDAVGGEMQACCINFNDALRELFGPQYGLERRLPIALQFVSFGRDQRLLLKKQSGLPPHVSSFISAFEHGLTDDELADPAFRMRVAFVPITSNRASGVDQAVEFVKPGSDEAAKVREIFLKEVNKRRFTATQVTDRMRADGFPKFSQKDHTKLWQELGAKDEAKGFGCKGDYRNTWVWFDSWITRVLAHCQEHKDRYA
jgi:hypothetical protein